MRCGLLCRPVAIPSPSNPLSRTHSDAQHSKGTLSHTWSCATFLKFWHPLQSNSAVGLGVLVNNVGEVMAAGGWLLEVINCKLWRLRQLLRWSGKVILKVPTTAHCWAVKSKFFDKDDT